MSPQKTGDFEFKLGRFGLMVFTFGISLLLLFSFIFLLRGSNKVASRFGLFALILVTLANLNMNADMALLGSRGFWFTRMRSILIRTISSAGKRLSAKQPRHSRATTRTMTAS